MKRGFGRVGEGKWSTVCCQSKDRVSGQVSESSDWLEDFEVLSSYLQLSELSVKPDL
jgi:hypothetical protein